MTSKPKKIEITMNKVKSSQVTHAGYDPESKTLQIQYKSGGTYSYKDVSQDDYDKLQKAESFGKCMQSHICGKHSHVKL